MDDCTMVAQMLHEHRVVTHYTNVVELKSVVVAHLEHEMGLIESL